MNILMIPSWYPGEPNEIYGSFFREQAIAMSEIGNNVYILNGTYTSFKNLFKRRCTSVTIQNDNGVKIYRKMIPSLGFSRNAIICTYLFEQQVLKLLAVFQSDNPMISIDLIHAHSCYPAGAIACKLGRKLHVPVIITEHRSKYMSRELSRNQRELLKYCINNSNQFICVSNRLKRNLEKATDCGEDIIKVIPNMVSSIFRMAPSNKHGKKTFDFISVGGLIPLKQHYQLINCFYEAFKNNHEVRLTIIGEGSERRRLENQIDLIGMKNRIRLLGKQSRMEVALRLQSSDAFALTSIIETFGVVYIEALACGIPIIGTRNGGAEDIINEKNGILIDVNNDQQLVNALKFMYYNRNNYDEKIIAAEAEEKYSEVSIAKRIQQVYERAVSGYELNS